MLRSQRTLPVSASSATGGAVVVDEVELAADEDRRELEQRPLGVAPHLAEGGLHAPRRQVAGAGRVEAEERPVDRLPRLQLGRFLRAEGGVGVVDVGRALEQLQARKPCPRRRPRPRSAARSRHGDARARRLRSAGGYRAIALSAADFSGAAPTSRRSRSREAEPFVDRRAGFGRLQRGAWRRPRSRASAEPGTASQRRCRGRAARAAWRPR